MKDHRPESASPTTKDLISQLRTSFFATDFENVTKKLVEREEQSKKEYIMLKRKTESLENKHNDDLKKKNSEIDELKKLNSEYETKIRVSEKRFLDLNVRVLSLEKLGKELTSKLKNNCPTAAVAAENNRQPLVSENENSNKRTDTKFPEIIQIDDDDDNDYDRECTSTLKRKKASNEIKKEWNNDDDYTECISILKKQHVSKETQKSKDLEDLHNQPITSHPLFTPSAKNKPFLEKHKPNNPLFSLDSSENSDEDIDKIDEGYMSLIAKMKKQKQRWEFEADMVKEFDKDIELCMNAICALRRQRIFLYGPDISRINHLARFLIDGDPQGKLKKKASEFNHFDLEEFQMFARKYATQIFNIYETKKDPFFPSRN